MTLVVEPVLTLEKLRECLAEHHEQSALDYKKLLDFQTTKDTLEFAKDVAAFQAEPMGGYVVVGSDGHGNPVSDLASIDLGQFDESRLRARIEKYFSGPFDVRSACHVVDGQNLVLLYIGPSRGSWAIFAQDGEYKDPKTGKPCFVFRKGEVFVRRGTSSTRWNSEDRDRLLAQVVAHEREKWRRESREEFAQAAAIRASVGDLQRSGGGISILDWQLDAAAYDELTLQLLRNGDDIPLMRVLYQFRRDATNLYNSGSDQLVDLLDRVTQLGAIALQFNRRSWFMDAVSCLVRIYENGFDARGFETNDRASATLWLEIISRAHALGGLAVRIEDWQAVSQLASRRPKGDQFRWYASWLRHGLTMGSRQNMLNGEDNLIARGGNVARRLEALRPDEALESEAITTSLCQFDVYGCISVMGSQRSIDTKNFYPSFARYLSHRSEPAFVCLVENDLVRTEVFGTDKEWLAVCMKELIRRASMEGVQYASWMDITDQGVHSFISANGPSV